MKPTKLIRQILIINTLTQNPNGLSKKEIVKFIQKKFDDYKYSKPTLDRDLADIRYNFNIDLKYNTNNQYEINEFSVNNTRIDLLLNSFKIFSTLMLSSGLPPHILPEKRKANGIMHFPEISDAISKTKFIEFDYLKFDSSKTEHKKVKPYALKESKNRWYLIGSYENQTDFRAFGLDRISNLYESDQSFKNLKDWSEINDYYKDSFAMFTDEKVEFVKLSFDSRDGNYIKTFPIHPSQKCELDVNNNRYIITLNIRITLDFIMELLSRSWSLEVLEPDHLRKKVVKIFEDALDRNRRI